MKILGFVLAGILTFSMSVSAQETMSLELVSGGDGAAENSAQTMEQESMEVIEGSKIIEIPDVTGRTEEEAVDILKEALPEEIEIIKNYAYSAEVPLNEIYEQIPVGAVAAEETEAVYLSISMGQEPVENLASASTEVNKMNSFGIAAYLEPTAHPAGSMLGIDWDSLPCSYEYNWDNSGNCWYWGMWHDGVCYKTPVGEYDTNVRHKMQLYCDGTYVYLRVVFATAYWDDVNGNDYRFYIDNNLTAFQLEYENGTNITGKTDTLETGTHSINVMHRNPWMSGQKVDGALGYLTKYENNLNAEVELMIPLSQMEYQNAEIDIENMGTIEFFTPNLMYRRITASGASTFPLATASAAFVLIPASTILLERQKKKKKAKDFHEQGV